MRKFCVFRCGYFQPCAFLRAGRAGFSDASVCVGHEAPRFRCGYFWAACELYAVRMTEDTGRLKFLQLHCSCCRPACGALWTSQFSFSRPCQNSVFFVEAVAKSLGLSFLLNTPLRTLHYQLTYAATPVHVHAYQLFRLPIATTFSQPSSPTFPSPVNSERKCQAAVKTRTYCKVRSALGSEPRSSGPHDVSTRSAPNPL